jgi:glycosyltransferase involved in cell wall biosynthesis
MTLLASVRNKKRPEVLRAGLYGRLAPKRAAIGHVLHSLNVGGAEMLAARLGRRFADEYRVCFICLDELGELGAQLRKEGFSVHVLNRRPGVDWRTAAQLGGFLRHEDIEIVHAHQYTPFFYALMARWLWRQATLVFHEHGRHQPDYPRPKRILLNRTLLGRRDRVVAVGQAVRKALIDNEGLPPARVEIIYNGVALASSEPIECVRTEVRGELAIRNDAFMVIQVARLDPIKDHVTALRAFAALCAQRANSVLVLVGDGPEREALAALARQLGIDAKTRFLGTRGDVRRLLAAADVFLLSSISEGIPLTVIEAMAEGLPVVATNVGGMNEVVLDGDTGLLAPSGCPEKLGRLLVNLAGNAEMRAALGRNGRRRCEVHFADAAMFNQWSKLYQSILGQRCGHGS